MRRCAGGGAHLVKVNDGVAAPGAHECGGQAALLAPLVDKQAAEEKGRVGRAPEGNGHEGPPERTRHCRFDKVRLACTRGPFKPEAVI